MNRVLVINGSPNMEKGHTAGILAPFVDGMKEAGATVEIFYAKKLNVSPCRGEFNCWYKNPGVCIIKDSMQLLYDAMKKSEILIIATPVYAPLPGELQNMMNRMMPIIEPVIEIRKGRMRARLHEGIAVKKVLAMTTGGWWEKENSDVVIQIVREMAENGGMTFAGAVVRPHVDAMLRRRKITEEGKSILASLREAGALLVSTGSIPQDILDTISRPLIDAETYRSGLNQDYDSARR